MKKKYVFPKVIEWNVNKLRSLSTAECSWDFSDGRYDFMYSASDFFHFNLLLWKLESMIFILS